ncbi:SDR family oxidoreductase [Bradyrhizobium sp. CSA207]|uniref:SDR family oxidoreductase n=1 Tax=Bradyrhizobium sp. CSA207 TaxID=2698826 RepID=UPI0023B0BD2D|nr:SDR family oxidoreductase [Bradyrhizobium sp. CSA207]MDE5446334.1 SDR family oxidoreductase [Bradyrhizobium sp. CSA207]
MDLAIADKTYIVTGGTDGLGLATAECLLAEGAKVLVTGRTEEKFLKAQASLKRGADKLAFLAADNIDPELPKRLHHAVVERWGRLDGLLVSAGGPPAGKVLTTGDESWRLAFESAFLGTIRLVRDLAPIMSDGGAIAFVLAISAKEAALNLPISSGLRPGLAMLTKNFADELGPRNIRVNALLPNLFATARIKAVLGDKEPPISDIALKRIGDPAEFGRVATFLLSPAASYVNGAAISVDGGQLKSL